MSLNQKSGKSIIDLSPSNPTIPDNPNQNRSDLSPEVQAVLSNAENNIDLRNVKIKRQKKDLAIQRTYLIKIDNIQRMQKINELQGSDFSWQINTALENWFATVHPQIQITSVKI